MPLQLQLQLLLQLQQLQLRLQLQQQLQIQLHYNYTSTTTSTSTILPQQLPRHYTTTTTTAATTTLQLQQHQPHYNYNYNYCSTPHYIQELWVRCPLQPLQLSKKHNSNHLSVHQWIRSAIHASQQLTSPIVSYPWNFRHRRVRYYWYDGNNNNCGWTVMNNEHMSNKSKHSCQQGELSISSKLVKTTTQIPVQSCNPISWMVMSMFGWRKALPSCVCWFSFPVDASSMYSIQPFLPILVSRGRPLTRLSSIN